MLLSEQGIPEIERLLVAAVWGVRRLANFAMFVPGVKVVLPDPALLANLRQKGEVPFRIRALLVELTSFNCTFAHGAGAWELQCTIAELQE